MRAPASQASHWRIQHSQILPGQQRACCHPPLATALPLCRQPPAYQSAKHQSQAAGAIWQMESLAGAPSHRSSWLPLGEPSSCCFASHVCLSMPHVLSRQWQVVSAARVASHSNSWLPSGEDPSCNFALCWCLSLLCIPYKLCLRPL